MKSNEVSPILSKTSVWTGRIITGIVGLFLLFDGLMKVIKHPAVMKYAVQMGFSANAIQGIGIALVVSTTLYLIAHTSMLGAILLTGYLGGAIATHVHAGESVFAMVFAGMFGVVAWLGLFLREGRLHALIPFRRTPE